MLELKMYRFLKVQTIFQLHREEQVPPKGSPVRGSGAFSILFPATKVKENWIESDSTRRCSIKCLSL